MRRTRRHVILGLAIAPLLALGVANARAAVHRAPMPTTGGVQQRVVVIEREFPDPFLWDPFWHPRPFDFSYPAYVQIPPRNSAPMELHVSPRKATVIVDGTNVGQARDYNSDDPPLWLNAGAHEIELRYPGYQTLRFRFDVRSGQAYKVHYELHRGEGLDSRSVAALTGTGS